MFSFYGVEQHVIRPDRLYKMYVTERGMYGAYLAGQVYDDESAEHFLRSMFLIALFFEGWTARRVQRRWEREKRYRHMPTSDHALDSNSAAFLRRDRRNFRIAREDIRAIVLRRKKSSWMRRMPIAGEIELRLRRSVLTLILPTDQSFDAIRNQFSQGSYGEFLKT